MEIRLLVRRSCDRDTNLSQIDAACDAAENTTARVGFVHIDGV